MSPGKIRLDTSSQVAFQNKNHMVGSEMLHNSARQVLLFYLPIVTTSHQAPYPGNNMCMRFLHGKTQTRHKTCQKTEGRQHDHPATEKLKRLARAPGKFFAILARLPKTQVFFVCGKPRGVANLSGGGLFAAAFVLPLRKLVHGND
jgi:hypothetical protein